MTFTDYLAEVTKRHGATVRLLDTCSTYTIDALRALAQEAGATPRAVTAADVGELITLYQVALKREQGAREVAAKMNRKYDPTPSAYDPFGGVAQQAPSAPIDLHKYALRETTEDLQRQIYAHKELLNGASHGHKLVLRSIDNLDSQVAALASLNADTLASTVRSQVQEALAAQQPTNLVVTTPSATTPVDLGLVHYRVPELIKAMAAGVNLYLHGPAGSGKTTACMQVAKALGLDFYFSGKVESEYLLLGFRDARGETVRTPFREAYEHGGLFLFDEFDGSGPGAIVAINAALANGVCSFPDGTIARHPDFKCIAAGNTVLTGATVQYQGRSALDGASVDRFAFIEFDYDEKLERALASNAGWCAHVQAIRTAVAERGLRHLVSPRATLDGCKLLDAGFSWEDAEAMSVFKGLDGSTVAQLRAAVSMFSAGNAQAA